MSEQKEKHTRGSREQSRILRVDTKTDSQYGQNIERDYPEKSRFDHSRDALVWMSGFSSCDGDELNGVSGLDIEGVGSKYSPWVRMWL